MRTAITTLIRTTVKSTRNQITLIVKQWEKVDVHTTTFAQSNALPVWERRSFLGFLLARVGGSVQRWQSGQCEVAMVTVAESLFEVPLFTNVMRAYCSQEPATQIL
jgi:hypothetical protein